MQIDIYFRGGLDNNFTGVYGISNIVIPLIKELKSNGHVIRYIGDEYKAKPAQNPFVNLCLDKNVQSVKNDVVMNNVTGDVLLIEMRPIEAKAEFDKVCNLIKDSRVPVLLWDTDLWCKDLPNDLKDKVTLLRPYLHENKEFTRQREFHYYMTAPMQETDRELDFCYVGNEYGRREKFDKFIGELSKQEDMNVYVGGNWLKKSKRDASLEFESILYIGNVPHWSAKPLFNHSKTTLQIVRKEYEKVGLMSHRIFEAATAGCVCFADNDIYGIEKFVPRELIVDNADEIYYKFKQINKMKVVTSSHEEMTGLQYYAELQRAMLQEHTVQKRVKQLESIIKEVV